MVKRGRPKIVKTADIKHPDDIICYICNKRIKKSQRYYAIGKNKQGFELYRHLKCKPVYNFNKEKK